jgi:hypothetical protein
VKLARRGVVAALLMAATLAGCTEVSTDPQVPLSLQFDSLPSLAVVVGDTMRDTALAAARINVRVFNSAGGVVSDSQIRVIGIDTASVNAFRLLSGLRVVGRTVTPTVRIVAQSGSLQSQIQTFAVVPVPLGITNGDAVNDSIFYNAADTTRRSADVKVSVFSRVAPDTTTLFLNGLRVRFRVASFADSLLDSVRLVPAATSGSVTGSRTATSALITGNTATIRVKVYPKPSRTAAGLITIEASFRAFGAEIPGSPFRIPVRLIGVGSPAP